MFFVLAAGLPLAIALWLLLKRPRNGWLVLSLCLFLLTGVVYSGFVAFWPNYGYYSLAIVAVVSAVALIVTLVRARSLGWERPSLPSLMACALLTLAAAWMGNFSVGALGATAAPASSIALAFPLPPGTYAVAQGGAGGPLQMGHLMAPSQRYAVDLVGLDPSTLRRSATTGPPQTDAFTLDLQITSPCEGEVVWARNDVDDSPSFDSNTPAGNVVGVACHGALVYLAHMRKGSVTVQEGDAVTAGQPLGRLGLSGRTLGPHLHIHAERGEHQGDFSDNEPVAMTFGGKFPWTGQILVID